MKIIGNRVDLIPAEGDEINIFAEGIRVVVARWIDGEVKVKGETVIDNFLGDRVLQIIPNTEQETRTQFSHWFTTVTDEESKELRKEADRVARNNAQNFQAELKGEDEADR